MQYVINNITMTSKALKRYEAGTQLDDGMFSFLSMMLLILTAYVCFLFLWAYPNGIRCIYKTIILINFQVCLFITMFAPSLFWLGVGVSSFLVTVLTSLVFYTLGV